MIVKFDDVQETVLFCIGARVMIFANNGDDSGAAVLAVTNIEGTGGIAEVLDTVISGRAVCALIRAGKSGAIALVSSDLADVAVPRLRKLASATTFVIAPSCFATVQFSPRRAILISVETNAQEVQLQITSLSPSVRRTTTIPISFNTPSSPVPVAISACRSQLAILDQSLRVFLFRLADRVISASFSLSAYCSPGFVRMCWAPNEKYLFTACGPALLAWENPDHSAFNRGKQRVTAFFGNIKKSLASSNQNDGQLPLSSPDIPSFKIIIPVADVIVQSKTEAGIDSVEIHDFHFIESEAKIVSNSEDFTICAAWSVDLTKSLHISIIVFSHLSTSSKTDDMPTIKHTSTIGIQYSNPTEHISKISRIQKSIYIVIGSKSTIKYLSFNPRDPIAANMPTLALIPNELLPNRIPAPFLIHSMSPLLAAHISRTPTDLKIGTQQRFDRRCYAFLATAHHSSQIALWAIEAGSTCSRLVDTLSLKTIVPFGSGSSDDDEEAQFYGSDVQVKYVSRGGWLTVTSGAVMAILREKVWEEMEDGDLGSDDGGVMAELDRVVDEVLGVASPYAVADAATTVDTSITDISVASFDIGTAASGGISGDESIDRKLTKQITSLQLRDLDADTDESATDSVIDIPIVSSSDQQQQQRQQQQGKELDSPKPDVTERDYFIKNNTALVIKSFSSTEPWIERWNGIVQIMASGVIEIEETSFEFGFIAFGTGYGDFTVIDLDTGVTVLHEIHGSSADFGSRIAVIMFANTFSERASPPNRFLTSTSSSNARPHMLAILNQNGDLVSSENAIATSQKAVGPSSFDTEHFLVFSNTQTVAVFLAVAKTPGSTGCAFTRITEKRHDGGAVDGITRVGQLLGGWLGKVIGSDENQNCSRGGEKSINGGDNNVGGGGGGGGGSVTVKSGVVIIRREPKLLLVHENGDVTLFSLPQLEVEVSGVAAMNGETFLASDRVWILDDGFVGVWGVGGGNFVKISRDWLAPSSKYDLNHRFEGPHPVKLYDFVKEKAEMQHLGSDILAERENQFEDLFKGESQSQDNKSHQQELPKNPLSGFQETKNKLNERGERLANLENSFAELSQGSADFLKTIKDFNTRQAQKKWYEL
ncbi:hypothetical protein HK100_000002 [Physocladia obscura]|uniref:V-SNARE coiled-coil homology domain-containing protein n=1 Tax=Physocladia obscura TaxID=109957 RepID=A0AAD5TBT4_9FUNG|nr:hypothetical protein HK100_000002 [Physocladia obscura]